MQNHMETEERFDRYLLNQMEPDERMELESELRENTELQASFELHRSIFEGVQRVNMYKSIRDIAEKQKSAFIFDRGKGIFSMNKHTIRTFSYALATAACIVCVCVFSLRLNTANYFKTAGAKCYSELNAPITRSSDNISGKMIEIYDLIGADQLDSAQTVINEVEGLICQDVTDYGTEEQAEYEKAIRANYLEDINWYQAIVYMKAGKIAKAKKILKEIVNTDGAYCEEAKNILSKGK